MPDNNYLNEKVDINKFLMGEADYCEFVEKNPEFLKYIDFEKKRADDKIVFEYTVQAEENKNNSINIQFSSVQNKSNLSERSLKSVADNFDIDNGINIIYRFHLFNFLFSLFTLVTGYLEVVKSINGDGILKASPGFFALHLSSLVCAHLVISIYICCP